MHEQKKAPLPLEQAAERFEAALDRLERAKLYAKANHLGRFLDTARKLLSTPGGAARAYEHAMRFDTAGVFHGSDWARPDMLKSNLVPITFQNGDPAVITIECLSELRLLAVMKGGLFQPFMAAEQAAHFLTRVLALNMDVLFGVSGEAGRKQNHVTQAVIKNHMRFLAEEIGYENILDSVVEEVWRLLRQRPVQVDFIKAMITRAAECVLRPDVQFEGGIPRGLDSLISALYGPTENCREDPGLGVYLERIQGLHDASLEREAHAFARAMHDTGLVSPYHATFVRHILEVCPDLVPAALGLSSSGREGYYCYRELMCTLIDRCVHPETCQAILGLAAMLERGILFQPAVSASFWRMMKVVLTEESKARIAAVFGTAQLPRVFLMTGIVNVLGHPLGLGQGNNPVCQSTRAISMWAYSDPDFLLQLTRWAARDDKLVFTFEGQSIASDQLPEQHRATSHFDLDPVSLLLVPHLDKLYLEMYRRTEGRGEDPHRWVNPEFHGWRVNRGFAIAVDAMTGEIGDLHRFVQMFLTLYHPYYNGETPLVHPQPAGIAVTDSLGRYVGWHAITIQRVMLDHENVMRVYFFNPNNDSGQDWGKGVVVSTHGYGEWHGESSLPIHQFCSRLYLFHYDPLDFGGSAENLPEETVAEIVAMAQDSWVASRGR